MHHINFGNFYTREVYATPIPIGFIPIPIPIVSRMAIPIPMGFPWGFPLPCTPLVCTADLVVVVQYSSQCSVVNEAAGDRADDVSQIKHLHFYSIHAFPSTGH